MCELGGVGKAVVQAHHHPAMQEAGALVRDAAAALLRSIVKPLFAFLWLPAKDRRLRAGVQASVKDVACTIKNLAVCAFESLGRG